MTLEKSQRQQRASPVTRHFPALGHRAPTPNYRWINWWQLGQVLPSCTLRSAAVHHLRAGEGSARGFWAAPFAALCGDGRWHPWQSTGTCWDVDWESWGAAGCLTGMCPQGRNLRGAQLAAALLWAPHLSSSALGIGAYTWLRRKIRLKRKPFSF